MTSVLGKRWVAGNKDKEHVTEENKLNVANYMSLLIEQKKK